MTGQDPHDVRKLLKTGALAGLGAEAAARRELAARVRAALPADEALHVVSASLDKDGRLIVGMDSAAWAARLRYAAGSLLGFPLRVRVAAPGDQSRPR